MLIKKSQRDARRSSMATALSGQAQGVDRRAFLRRSGIAAGALAGISALPLGNVRNAHAAPRQVRRRRGVLARLRQDDQ